MEPNPHRLFPGWLRRLDPLLEAEDTNPLFEAFRVRECEHLRRRGWFSWSWRRARRRASAWGRTALNVMLILVVFSILTIAVRSVFLVLALVLGISLFSVISRMVHSSGRFPSSSTDLMMNLRRTKQAALDIWLTGITAHEVAVALYLEGRRGEWKVILLVLSAPVTSLLTILFSVRGYHHGWGTLLVAAAVYFLWEAFAILLSGFGGASIQRVLREWNRDLEPPGSQVAKAIGYLVIGVAAAIPILLLMGHVFRGIGALIVAYWNSLEAIPAEGRLAILLVGAGLLLRSGRGWARNRNLRSFLRLAGKIEERYPRYFRRFIGGDTERG